MQAPPDPDALHDDERVAQRVLAERYEYELAQGPGDQRAEAEPDEIDQHEEDRRDDRSPGDRDPVVQRRDQPVIDRARRGRDSEQRERRTVLSIR